jgi:hypothetical protein
MPMFILSGLNPTFYHRLENYSCLLCCPLCIISDSTVPSLCGVNRSAFHGQILTIPRSRAQLHPKGRFSSLILDTHPPSPSLTHTHVRTYTHVPELLEPFWGHVYNLVLNYILSEICFNYFTWIAPISLSHLSSFYTFTFFSS